MVGFRVMIADDRKAYANPQRFPEAREIRSIACEAADARIFHSILTPNYDRPHRNHFHLEVTAGVQWFIVR